jgi:hypothetical protein
MAMRNLKSQVGISSAMSAPAQHVYKRACEIESYEEDGEVYNREKLLVRSHNPIFIKEHVPEKCVSRKPFLTTVQLFKRPFPLRRLHNWYMMVSSLGVTNITFEIPETPSIVELELDRSILKTCGSCSTRSGST